MNRDEAVARSDGLARGTVTGLGLAVPTWAALAGAWWLGRHQAGHHGTATLVALLLAAGAARAGRRRG